MWEKRRTHGRSIEAIGDLESPNNRERFREGDEEIVVAGDDFNETTARGLFQSPILFFKKNLFSKKKKSIL